MKYSVSIALVVLLFSCEAERVIPQKSPEVAAVRPLETDTIIETDHSIEVSEPCAVYFSPSPNDLDSLKRKVGEEDFYVIMDDNMWYTSESYTFFSAKGIPTLEAEEKKVRFHLSNGQTKEYSSADEAVKWNIVLFDGKSAVSIISAIDAEQEFQKLFQ